MRLWLILNWKQKFLFLKWALVSKSQLGQDVFVLLALEFKTNGYFVEFGATDGVSLSNTYLLESFFGWQGVLSEPAKVWRDRLSKNRKSFLNFQCVWKNSTDTLEFLESEENEFSTLAAFVSSDSHLNRRIKGKTNRYKVSTISLNDLLASAGSPKIVDYLSVDTEGSELDILTAFDFGKTSFRIITVEHNFTSQRSAIMDLLTKQGYVRVLNSISCWDDWYINPELIGEVQRKFLSIKD